MQAAPFPSRIGRYDVVGRLATGGMAEVLLGRLRGPHGFERPVVIKRILPHLAVDERMVSMFLDEARIIAGLRHPNLVAIHELGHHDGDLFMTMDYLEGESVSGICRRLAGRREHIDPYLAAHVVAEACAGLHAAHEATTTAGKPLGIVHRDVSPQNLFVTYAGTVHVIDFGIATTVDRVGRTETGTVRGKCEYLAPEQLQSIRADRRADVFGLGVVLFELASGRRLYRRSSHAETFMAILNEPVPSLRALRPEAPAELEAICARALAKDRGARHQTAAELRRDLLGFLRRQGGDAEPDERLRDLMHRLFGARADEKSVMVRRVAEGADLETLPEAEVDVAVEVPAVAEPTTLLSQSLSTPLPDASPRRTARRFLLPTVAAVMAAALAGVAWRGTSLAPARQATAAASQAPSASAVVAEVPPPLPAASAVTAVPASEPPLPSAQTSVRADGRPRPVPARAGRAAPPASAPLTPPRISPTLW